MDFQNIFTPADIGIADGDLAVKTAGAQKRGVENIGAVGCRDDDDAFVGAETVHFHEQLVKRLFAFIVTAAHAGASVAADGVDFINEDNRRGVFLCLVEQVADTRSADTDIHFYEIGTGNREERNVRFAGNRTRKQGFTGTGRADKQHAFRNSRAQSVERLGIFEEFDDFLQFFFFLVRTGDIGKRGFALIVAALFHARLAEGKRTVVFILDRLVHFAEHNEHQN